MIKPEKPKQYIINECDFDVIEYIEKLEKQSISLGKQIYKNAGTIGVLLDALFLSWDQSLNGNEVADKMRAVAQEYGYCLKCRGYCECDF